MVLLYSLPPIKKHWEYFVSDTCVVFACGAPVPLSSGQVSSLPTPWSWGPQVLIPGTGSQVGPVTQLWIFRASDALGHRAWLRSEHRRLISGTFIRTIGGV